MGKKGSAPLACFVVWRNIPGGVGTAEGTQGLGLCPFEKSITQDPEYSCQFDKKRNQNEDTTLNAIGLFYAAKAKPRHSFIFNDTCIAL